MNLTGVAQGTVQWRAIVEITVKIWVHKNDAVTYEVSSYQLYGNPPHSGVT